MEEAEDRCRFGHQLIPGSDSITLTETDPETGRILKQEKRLLRRHLVETGYSRFDTTGLVPIGCDHGLTVRRDGNLTEREGGNLVVIDGAQAPGRGGHSWIRSQFARLQPIGGGKGLVFRALCPVCAGEEPDPEMIRPRDGSFTPLPEDLPAWAR